MDQRLAIILNIENSKRVREWMETLPAIPFASRNGAATSPDCVRADLMDRCHHPDCAFQVRLISVHNHFHYQGLPLDQLYPVHWSEPSGSTATENTFWTARSRRSGKGSNDAGRSMEEDLSGEPEEEKEEKEIPRETPQARHAPFDMNLYQASWFHKLDLSDDAFSINEEDRDFLTNKPLEASTRKQISRQLRKLKWLRPRYPTKSQHIAPKLRQWKQAVVARLGGNSPEG
ncbi:hypothetical protein MauCBS54593_002760 [Microsporum audouinii]